MSGSMNTATWIIAIAALAQVVLAGALVWATNRYVELTSRLAASSEEQIGKDKTPNLVFEVREKNWLLTNIGEHGVLVDTATVQITSGDWKPQSAPVTLSDPGQGTDWFVSNWKRVIRPNDSIQLSHQAARYGRYIYTFAFFYGSTGTMLHELVVHLNLDGSDNATAFYQETRTARPTSGFEVQRTRAMLG
jgi:hypothetical protein